MVLRHPKAGSDLGVSGIGLEIGLTSEKEMATKARYLPIPVIR
jgi:hypothetical protein